MKNPTVCQGQLSCPASHRVHFLCEFSGSMARDYAGWDYKQTNLSLNLTKHFQDCIAQEAEVSDDSKLAFQDRVSKCLATLQDSHLLFYGSARGGSVFVPFQMKKIQDQYYVSFRWNSLMDEVPSDAHDQESLLPLGAKIVSIDGQTPEELSQTLQTYIPASSSSAREYKATLAMTLRNFFFPQRSTMNVEWEIDSQRYQTTLPWLMDQRILVIPEMKQYVQEFGLQTISLTSENNKWSGYFNEVPIFRDQVWLSTDQKNSGLVLALAQVDFTAQADLAYYQAGKTQLDGSEPTKFCYLKISTFGQEYVFDRKYPLDEKHMIEPILDLLETCEKDKLPLFLDLRGNQGGKMYLPSLLARYLIPGYQSMQGSAAAFSVRPKHFWENQSKMETWTPALASMVDGPMPHGFDHVFSQAASQVKLYSDFLDADRALQETLSKNSPWKDVLFSQKLVVLSDGGCVSACDHMLNLLHDWNRATFLGEQPAGTGLGAGYPWKGPWGEYTIEIPIFLFGTADRDVLFAGASYQDHGSSICTENRPVPMDRSFDLNPWVFSASNFTDFLQEQVYVEMAREWIAK
ncbi:MAG: S41 family peptidase [Bdellovibrionota bacterium]